MRLNAFKLLTLLCVLLSGGTYAAPSVEAFGQSDTTFTASGATFTIAGTAPEGVVVWVFQGGTTTPETITVEVDNGGSPVSVPIISGFPISSVNWTPVGGVLLHAFFVGSGVPTGTLTVTITKDGGSTTHASGYTINTANNDPAVNTVGPTIDSDLVTDPSDTIGLGGVESLVLMGFYSGENTDTDIAPLAGWTGDGEFDFGSIMDGSYSYDTVGTADVTFGWTQTSDAAFGTAISINETAGGSQSPVPIILQQH